MSVQPELPKTKLYSEATYNNRLLKLAKFLRELPPKRFNYGTWVGYGWLGRTDLSCGTTACALGWAFAMPEFNKLGFSLGYDKYRNIAFTSPGFGGKDWSDGAKELFGLSYRQAAYLFSGVNSHLANIDPGDVTTKQVANHIVRFVRARKIAQGKSVNF